MPYSWEEHVAEAERQGGIKHQPNGLPIRCVDGNWDMWEHEDANHPNYICPIKVLDPDFKADFPEANEWQTHAMIFCDENVVITQYETCVGIYTRKNKWQASADCFWKGTSLPEETLLLIRNRLSARDDG